MTSPHLKNCDTFGGCTVEGCKNNTSTPPQDDRWIEELKQYMSEEDEVRPYVIEISFKDAKKLIEDALHSQRERMEKVLNEALDEVDSANPSLLVVRKILRAALTNKE